MLKRSTGRNEWALLKFCVFLCVCVRLCAVVCAPQRRRPAVQAELDGQQQQGGAPGATQQEVAGEARERRQYVSFWCTFMSTLLQPGSRCRAVSFAVGLVQRRSGCILIHFLISFVTFNADLQTTLGSLSANSQEQLVLRDEIGPFILKTNRKESRNTPWTHTHPSPTQTCTSAGCQLLV